MDILALNLSLSFILFAMNGVLGRIQYGYHDRLFQYGKFSFAGDEQQNFAGNFFLKVVNPAIFMAICCALFQCFGFREACPTLWLIVPCYWIVRFLYVFMKNISPFINWKYEIFALITSLVLGEGVFFAVILPLIKNHERIFIPIEELRNAIWFAIIAYVAKSVWDISKSFLSAQALYPAEKRNSIIFKRYDKFQKKFGDYILQKINDAYPEKHDGKGNFICLFYAVMIFEDYNRPYLYRVIERLLKIIRPRRTMTLGIMQVQTEIVITDIKSIELAVDKMLAVYLRQFHNDPIIHTIEDYNRDSEYLHEVDAIYCTLLELLSIDKLIEDNEAYKA